MTPQYESYEFSHSVTSANTVKHWVLYTLDGIEAEHESEDENDAREDGITPERIYEYAGGEDSIVFNNRYEIGTVLSKMARRIQRDEGPRPVNRRTTETDWEGADVNYRYRLTPFGRDVLLDLGVPDKLPNRNDFDETDRALGVKPAHEPGWWQDTHELFADEWDIRDNDWVESECEDVYFLDATDGEMARRRGYVNIAEDLKDAFPDVTFVMTCGPYRAHDLMYAIRDPWRKVVQIDVYSTMVHHRSPEQITENIEALVRDLHSALETTEQELTTNAAD